MKKLLLLTILLCSSLLCQAQKERIVLGDEQTSEYFPILKGKRIAIFSNHTGMVGDKHLLDILLENKFNVVAIFHLNTVFAEMRMQESTYPVRSTRKRASPSFLFTTGKTKTERSIHEKI